jgi:hypothetical protein
MKVTAMVCNVETREVRNIEAEVPNYDAGYAQLQASIPDGWKMIYRGCRTLISSGRRTRL